MKNKFLIFLIIISSSVFSQVPGYMGKRLIVGYSNYFMVGFKGPGPINAVPSNENSLTLNNVHCLNFEYAHNQHKMLCFSGQYLRTGIAYNNGLSGGPFDLRNIGDYPYPNSCKYVGNYSTPALLTSFNIGIGIKSFKHGYLAPVGKYDKFEFLFLFEKIKYDYKNFVQSDNYGSTDIPYPLGTGEYSYKNFAIVYSFGRQKVLNDKIVLDYGLRVSYTPLFNIFSAVQMNDASTIEEHFKYETRSRIFREQLFNLHVGIGFLAF